MTSTITKKEIKLFAAGAAFVFQILIMTHAIAAKYSPITQGNPTTEAKFIFIGDMEHSADMNNLSLKGLYHSLLFASYMDDNNLPSNHVTAMYALFDVNYLSHGLPDLAPLQTMEYYSVYKTYHNNGIKTDAFKHKSASNCIDFGNCKVIKDLITSSTDGQQYVFSMPNEDINQLLTALQPQYGNFKFDTVPSDTTGNYVVLSVSDKKSIIAQTYSDGINAPNSYPPIVKPLSDNPDFIKDIGLLKHGSPTIKYSPKRSGLNTNETVYLVRHVEKYADTGNDISPDDGNYGCIGEWRSLFNPDSLYQIMGKSLPDYLYAPNPTQPYGASNYIRATTSISPFAIKFKRLQSLAPKEIGIKGELMYQYLFYTDHGGKLTGPNFNGKTVFVSWESGNINKIIIALAADYIDNSLVQCKMSLK